MGIADLGEGGWADGGSGMGDEVDGGWGRNRQLCGVVTPESLDAQLTCPVQCTLLNLVHVTPLLRPAWGRTDEAHVGIYPLATLCSQSRRW